MKSYDNVSLVRFNRSHTELTVKHNGNYYLVPEDELERYVSPNIKERYIPFKESIAETLKKIKYFVQI